MEPRLPSPPSTRAVSTSSWLNNRNSGRLFCWNATSKPIAPSAHRVLLKCQFGAQALEVAIHRGDCKHATHALVFQQAVPRRDAAIDGDLVPVLGVTDIANRHVVMLGPEKRHRIKRFTSSQHIARRSLSLTFGDHPVLDADVLA